jgi:hypothetical protein
MFGQARPKVLCSTHSGNLNADRARFSRRASLAAFYCGANTVVPATIALVPKSRQRYMPMREPS